MNEDDIDVEGLQDDADDAFEAFRNQYTIFIIIMVIGIGTLAKLIPAG